MPRLFSRAAFARMAKVAPPAITYACRQGKPLAAAADGLMIDIDHPAARRYAERHGGTIPEEGAIPADLPAGLFPEPARRGRPPKAAPGDPAQPPTDPGDPLANQTSQPTDPGPRSKEGPETGGPTPPKFRPGKAAFVSRQVADLSRVQDMTLGEICNEWGTAPAFREWVENYRKLAAAREMELRNAEAEGRLISIKLVQTHVMAAIESGNRRLLTDSPKTLARRLYAAAMSQVPIEEAERMVREIISSQLRPVRDATIRMLRNPDAA